MIDRLKIAAAGGLGFGLGALAVLIALGTGNRMDDAPRGAARQPTTATSYAEAVARAAPSVLRVFGQRNGSLPGEVETREHRSGTPSPPAGLSRGSAVVMSDDGLVVTSGHLVAEADSIGVQAPDRGIVPAELLGIDTATDLAVLRLAEPAGPPIALGEPEKLRPGDVVLAIGNPFGLDQTVSLGIVSALGRTHLGLTEIEDFIQTDAAINPGNSGGALIDTSGRLVGINAAIMSDSGYSEGVAFAIPADRVVHVVAEIVANGSVQRGWIGIGARTLDATLAQRFGVRAPGGVFVTRVLEGSPAAAAGVRVGDVIVKAGAKQVDSSPALREAVIAAGAGGEIVLELWRGSEQLTASVRTRLRPHAVAPTPRARHVSGDAATGGVSARGCDGVVSPDGC